MAFRTLPAGNGSIPDILEFKPLVHSDSRGYFSETYSKPMLRQHGVEIEFVQDNQSYSRLKGTVRGLHFQSPPVAQTKLVRVLKGGIFDVAVDIRHGSPTFGRHVTIIVTAEDWNQVLIPKGFAHGFCTLEPDTVVLYKVDAPYSRDHDHGVLWSDPALAIEWPLAPTEAILSDKDNSQPRLAELPIYFGGPSAIGVKAT